MFGLANTKELLSFVLKLYSGNFIIDSESSINSSISPNANNSIDSAAFSLIPSGRNNKISGSISSSVILGGENNLMQHTGSFILGNNLTSSADQTTLIENLTVSGSTTFKNSKLLLQSKI
mgnify:CR=1 FL=1